MKRGTLNKIQIMLLVITTLSTIVGKAQGRLVLNGAKVNITNGAVLVVSNPAANAITRTSGHIISEGENNMIRWNIGTTAASYTIPFGSGSSTYFPVSFTTSAAAGATGYFNFATLPTGAQNSASLPAGVTNFNGAAGDDMSLVAVDRFWKIDGQSYTTIPTLTNLVFTYLDAEYATPNRTTIENKLTARRWNNTANSWVDYNTGATVNTTNNTITVATIAAANMRAIWTMAYPGAAFHWIPSVASNSNNAANWSATAGGSGGLGVPGPGDAVFFDAIRDGNCVLNTPADIGSLTVASGYSGAIVQNNNAITVANNATLADGTFTGGNTTFTVNGNLNLNGMAFAAPTTIDIKQNLNITSGSFSHLNGTVRFSGTNGTQTITGNTTTFHNIDVTNTSANPGLRIESNTNLAGVLSLSSNVIVDADGTSNNKILTLLSTADDPTRDAAVGILPTGASITGNVTVQRFMSIEGSNNTRIYRYISSPVQNATVADLQQEISVTGSFTGTSTCTGCLTNQSMFYYRESVITDTNGNGSNSSDDGYIDFPDASNTEQMEPGRGYAVFVRGNNMTSAKWDVRGAINAGNVTPVTLPVTYTSSGNSDADGWNLVGNPFPSTIDWNAASGWTKTNMATAIYTRDNGNAISRYATWNGVVGTNNGSRYIASGQAFWVKASGTGIPILQASENVKAPGTQTSFFRQQAPTQLLRVTLAQGAVSDEAVIHFRDDATNDFDAVADAIKMNNTGFNLSTQLSGKEKLAINSLSKASCNTTLQVLVESAAKGNYTLNFSEIESFPAGTSITLKDAFLNTTVNVRSQSSYAFTVTADPLSTGTSRFSLVINTAPANTEFAAIAPDICVGTDGMITLTGINKQNSYEAFILGEEVAIAEDGSNENIQWNISKEKLQSGNNTLVIRATPLTCGTVNEKQITMTVADIYTPASVTNGSVCREGNITLTVEGTVEGSVYRWYANQSDTAPLFESSNPGFTTPVLNETKTYYASIANVLGCEGDRIAVTAEVIRYNDAVITANADSLYVNYNEGIQWYFNEELLEDEQFASIAALPGTYKVIVTTSGSCTTQATVIVPEVITENESDIKNTLDVYPNPVMGELHLKVSSHVQQVNAVVVRNEQGQHIGQFTLTKVDGQTTGTFDMTAKASGLYIVEMITNEGKVWMKVVKE